MRKPLTYLLVLLCSALSAQEIPHIEIKEISSYIDDVSKIPTITGKLHNYSKAQFPELSIRYTSSTPSYRKQEASSTTIGDNGDFAITLDRAFPYNEIWISVGDFYYGKIVAYKDFYLELDLAELAQKPQRFIGPGVAFSGADEQAVTFVNEYELYKTEKKQQLQNEKLSIIFDQSANKNEKVESLKKVYKKLASVEQSFSRKYGKDLQWLLANDRIASMYADILSIHWGKKMSDVLFNECVNFQPSILSNASIQYYDFLGFYLGIPNRLELKLITENTLREKASSAESTVSLDVFLREYSKKTDHLRFDQEIYSLGEDEYLKMYKKELLGARMDLQISKIANLKKEKANYVMLICQPESLEERMMFNSKVSGMSFDNWALKIGQDLLTEDAERQDDISEAITSLESSQDSLGKETHIDNAFTSEARTVNELLASISNKYKGKHIVINVWVPWIDKCKEDLIVNRAFAKAIDTLPVQMVYLCNSNDVTEEYWLKEVESFPLGGDHILLNTHLSSEIMETFKLRNYPAYLYISPNGRFDSYFINDLSDFDPSRLEGHKTLISGL